tara:strand:- start:3217 stop:3477 length:261 start_codon:yes stop_codon:yes gene_type:complete
MTQSRAMSFVETLTTVAVGYGAFLGAYTQPACRCPDVEKTALQFDNFRLRINEAEAGYRAITEECWSPTGAVRCLVRHHLARIGEP